MVNYDYNLERSYSKSSKILRRLILDNCHTIVQELSYDCTSFVIQLYMIGCGNSYGQLYSTID